MSREGYIRLLRQSVDQWNQWRAESRDRALAAAEHQVIDLQGANLRRVNLIGADLSGTILRRADLREANLIQANLSQTILIDADCRGADLSRVNLSQARLVQADLRRTILNGANLTAADLSRANLSKAVLYRANLNQANLSSADLSLADLSYVRALSTNFSAATLTAACVEGWQIDETTELESVICEYVYLRRHGQDRFPNPNALPAGASSASTRSRLFRQSLGRVELQFPQGINWQAFICALRQVSAKYAETHLAVHSVESQGNGNVVIQASVSPCEDRVRIQEDWMQSYEIAYHALIQQHQATPSPETVQFVSQSDVSSLFDLLVTTTPDVHSTSDHSITVEAKMVEARTVTTEAPSSPDPGLVNTAAEVRRLLVRMTQAYPTTTEAKRQALIHHVIQQIERKPLLKAQLAHYLQQGGIDALLRHIDHALAHLLLREFKLNHSVVEH